MKAKDLKYIVLFGFTLFLVACSVKKDKFINRKMHSLTSEYNILYNGNLALDAGLENLKTTFKDNFCRYCLLTDENGGIVNDPLVLKFNKNKVA